MVGDEPGTHMCDHLALATDPEDAVLSDWSAQWIINDIVSTSLEVDLFIDRRRTEHETWYFLVIYRLGLMLRRTCWPKIID